MILLGLVQLGIDSALGNQLHVVALLHHLTILDHTDHIRILDGGQSMGYDDTGSAGAGGIQGLLDQLFALQIQS